MQLIHAKRKRFILPLLCCVLGEEQSAKGSILCLYQRHMDYSFYMGVALYKQFDCSQPWSKLATWWPLLK